MKEEFALPVPLVDTPAWRVSQLNVCLVKQGGFLRRWGLPATLAWFAMTIPSVQRELRCARTVRLLKLATRRRRHAFDVQVASILLLRNQTENALCARRADIQLEEPRLLALVTYVELTHFLPVALLLVGTAAQTSSPMLKARRVQLAEAALDSMLIPPLTFGAAKIVTEGSISRMRCKAALSRFAVFVMRMSFLRAVRRHVNPVHQARCLRQAPRLVSFVGQGHTCFTLMRRTLFGALHVLRGNILISKHRRRAKFVRRIRFHQQERQAAKNAKLAKLASLPALSAWNHAHQAFTSVQLRYFVLSATQGRTRTMGRHVNRVKWASMGRITA
mmetsp:Transcript_15098/g.31121  ORF Transcript_15098/g.31121 Transcript_15098/m.31121 type:complete len:332 (+) Transcript_15098:772-1767(+)